MHQIRNVSSVKPKDRIHPTEKPIETYTIPMINHTREGEAVLDLFAGSGVIFEAANKLKRIGLGVELDNEACASILKRMMNIGCKISLESNLFESQNA